MCERWITDPCTNSLRRHSVPDGPSSTGWAVTAVLADPVSAAQEVQNPTRSQAPQWRSENLEQNRIFE